MTPEQIELVQASYAAIGEHVDEFAVTFYDRLFELDPSTRSLFSTEPAVQRAKFVEQLDQIVASISDLDSFVAGALELGARHVGYGTRTGHYKVLGLALVDALETTSTPGTFTEAHREAWLLAYNLLAETMMRGAASAPLPH